MLNKSYELSMSKNYVSHWGMVEGIRELLQNAIDSDSPFEWEFSDGTLLLHSRFSKLEPKTLLLGTSNKADDPESIGNFGEGYKIAMLVLTRLGYDVKIHNCRNIWTPEFRFNRKYESEMLYVVSTSASTINEGVTFEVSGLSDFDFDQIQDTCLHLQDEIGEIKQTQYGKILINKPGRLYVGGLFICNNDLRYGYDIEPRHIKLERDRQTVSNYDLQMITTKMWFESDDMELVVSLIEANLDDVGYADWNTPEIVKDACYRHFRAQHPEEVIAKDQSELDSLVEKGMKVYVSGGYYGGIVKSTSAYQADVKDYKLDISVHQELDEWFGKNKKYMRRQAIVSFKKLLIDAKKWKR